MKKKKKYYHAIGTMSGTSFDGVDVALIKTDGEYFIEKIFADYIEYNANEKIVFNDSIIKNYREITKIIDRKHELAIEKIYKKTSLKIDVIGLHGQTFHHSPENRWTWQYINPTSILKNFKTNVISDFRLADINRGGEGAPLVPIFHKYLILSKKFKLPCAILNIGGISNATILNKKLEMVGLDLGPGNGPSDLLVNKRLNLFMDKRGEIASQGKVNEEIKYKTIKLFQKKMISNTYDRALLDKICLTYLDGLSTRDAMATIIEIVAHIISTKLNKFSLEKLIISGGGRLNKYLIKRIKNKVPYKVLTTDETFIDGDSMEAQAFAYLAVRSIKGIPNTFNSTTGVKRSANGGTLYYAKY